MKVEASLKTYALIVNLVDVGKINSKELFVKIKALSDIMMNKIIVRKYANGMNLRHRVDIRFPTRRYSALIFLCTLGGGPDQ